MTTRDPYSSGAGVPPAIPTGRADTPEQGQQAPGAQAEGTVEQAKQTAGELATQARESAGELVDQAKEQAKPRLESQKERAAGSLGSAAHALRQTGRQLRDQDEGGVAQSADRAAEQIERFSDYLRARDVDDLIGEAEHFARRQPVLFLGGAFLLGVLGARFLKASSQRARGRREQAAPLGGYVPPPRYASALPTELPGEAALGTTPGYEAGTRTGYTAGMETQTPPLVRATSTDDTLGLGPQTPGYEPGTPGDYTPGMEGQTPGYDPGTRTGRSPGLEER